MNEVVYWYSYIDDPRTLVVVELVAIERDQKHGIEVNQLFFFLSSKKMNTILFHKNAIY